MPSITTRHDYALEEIRSIHDLPLFELVDRARDVHRQVHEPSSVELVRCSAPRPAAVPRIAATALSPRAMVAGLEPLAARPADTCPPLMPHNAGLGQLSPKATPTKHPTNLHSGDNIRPRWGDRRPRERLGTTALRDGEGTARCNFEYQFAGR